MTLTTEDLLAIKDMLADTATKGDFAAIKDDITELKGDMSEGFSTIKGDIMEINKRLDALERNQEVTKASQLRTELEQYPRIAGALDGVIAAMKKNEAQDERISILDNTVKKHDVRITKLEFAME